MRLRVIVYNVRGFRDGFERLVRLVGHFEPDLVLLNETGSRWRLRRFANALGMELAADPWSPLRRRVKDAVLVRPPWTIARAPPASLRGGTLALPPRCAGRDARARRREARARSRRISVFIRVSGSRTPGRSRRSSTTSAHPIVAGGDLNERPDGRAVGFLSERFRDAWLLGGDADGDTFPADEPTARIDYLFVSEGIVVERVLVPPGPDAREASDHRPLVAELTLAGSE